MTEIRTAQSEPAPSVEQVYRQALQSILQTAVSHHQAGRMPEAEQFYRAVLQSEPEQPQANHNLGLMLLQMRQPAAALPYLEIALAAEPESARHWLSYLDALAQDGQSELARERLAYAREHGLEGAEVETLAAMLHAVTPALAPSGVELQASN